MSIAASMIDGMFELTKGDVDSIREDAQKTSLKSWQNAQIAKATSIGGAAAAIPIAGYLTMPADIAALFRIMHRSAIGTCQHELGYADDGVFAGVLAVWSGALVLDSDMHQQVVAKTMAKGATMAGGQAGVKLAIEALNISAQVIIAKKLGPKIAQKIALKMTTKLAAKATTRWIPVMSAVVGGGANWYIIRGMNKAAMDYSNFINRVHNE